MRRELLALGIIFLFLGLVFISISREAIEPKPEGSWIPVDEDEEQTPSLNRFVQGNLEQGDKFRIIYREAITQPEFIIEGATVYINLTDPLGHVKTYEIEYEMSETEQVVPLAKLPSEFLANDTGSYKVSAQAIWGIALSYLALLKFELKETEPFYPNSNLFPVGIVIIFGGVGVSLLGSKISKPRKIRSKRRLHKTLWTMRKPTASY